MDCDRGECECLTGVFVMFYVCAYCVTTYGVWSMGIYKGIFFNFFWESGRTGVDLGRIREASFGAGVTGQPEVLI